MSEEQQTSRIVLWLCEYWGELISIVGTIASSVGLWWTYKVYQNVEFLYGLKTFGPKRIAELVEFHREIANSFHQTDEEALEFAFQKLSKAKGTINDLSRRFQNANDERYKDSFLESV